MEQLAGQAQAQLLQTLGVGAINAAQLLVTAGDNPDRLRSEAAFAMLCGACPIPASSGRITRYRLNRGGGQQHPAPYRRGSPAQGRSHPFLRANRRRSQGNTDKEILRCLKRVIAREIHHLLTTPPPVIDASQLRPLRHAAGLTLAQAAADLGHSASYLSGIERGRSTNRELLTAYRDYLTTRQHTG